MRQARTDASSTSLPSQPAPDNHASRMAARYESGRKCGQGRGHTREDKLRKRETRRLAQERGERQDHLSAIHRNKLLHIYYTTYTATTCITYTATTCITYTATTCITYTTHNKLHHTHHKQQVASHTPHTRTCITYSTTSRMSRKSYTTTLCLKSTISACVTNTTMSQTQQCHKHNNVTNTTMSQEYLTKHFR